MGIGHAFRHIGHRISTATRGRRRRAVGGGLALVLVAGVMTAGPALAVAPDPDPPTGVTAVATGDTSATVSWTAPAFDGGTPITGYQISAQPGQAKARINSSATSGLIDGLTTGLTYTFTVRAINQGGFTSAPSEKSNPVVAGGGAAATAPGAPTSVTAVAGDGSATVSWTPPASDGGAPITGYRINSQPGKAHESPGPSDTSWTFPGLIAGVSYTFTVMAINSVGMSVASDPSNAVVAGGTPPTAPDAPTNVSAVAGNGSATVSWTAPAHDGGATITQYSIQSKPAVGAPVTVTPPATSGAFPGLTNGVDYTFTVKAVNSAGMMSTGSAASRMVRVGGVDDWDGDGKADLIARNANGDLRLYTGAGTSTGSFTGTPRTIGTGWRAFDRILSASDWTGDGKADLLARKPNGELWLYTGARTASGGFTGTPRRINAGWQIFDTILSPGDWTGDGKADLLARKPNGELWLYTGAGTTSGGFTGTPRRINAGWQIFDTIIGVGL
jgi:hypothetical protein